MTDNKENAAKICAADEMIDENSIIRKLSIVGIAGNIVLSIFKLIAGIVGHSNAMISDAVHSMSDVFATFIAYLGVRMSKREADKEHPYGHERLECVASMLLGVILFATGLGIGKMSIQNIFGANSASLAVPGIIAMVAAIISIIVKEAMYWYTRHYAKILNSAAFMADAWHHRSDAFSSIGSMIGIGGAMLGYPVLDSVAGVIICIFILKVAADILWDAVKKMLDTSCGEEFEGQLAEYIAGQEGVVNIDMLSTRMFGNKVYVDLEIEVDGSKTLREAHEVAERVHDSMENEFNNIKHVMIHINPDK